MPYNKLPRPDGLPDEFYKHFWQIMSLLFYRVVTEMKTSSTNLMHMNTVVMTLLLKSNKDPIYPTSYRPLSLINTDLKVVTKVLATRIETVILILIHHDQTGFIKHRNASDNTHRLFNLISLAQQKQTKTVIVSLDAEKAYDKVKWTFLFNTFIRIFGLESCSFIG